MVGKIGKSVWSVKSVYSVGWYLGIKVRLSVIEWVEYG